MSKARYQKGCVSLIKNGSGQQVWVFRWRTTLPDGKRVPRQKVIGTLERYNSKAATEKVAAGLRLLINADGPNEMKAVTMQALIEHYKTTELIDQGDEGKSFSTRHRYESCLRHGIVPRWGEHQLGEIKTVAVEQWLQQLDRANGTKAKIRNLMGALFNHAIR